MNPVPIIDIYQAAYICVLGHDPVLENANGRLVFMFDNNESVLNALAQYNTNAQVNVVDYATKLKTLRSLVFEKRKGDNR